MDTGQCLTKDGRRLEMFVEHAVGSLDHPMSDKDLESKFTGLAAGVLPPDRQRKLYSSSTREFRPEATARIEAKHEAATSAMCAERFGGTLSGRSVSRSLTSSDRRSVRGPCQPPAARGTNTEDVAGTTPVHLALHNTNPNLLVEGPTVIIRVAHSKVRRAGYRSVRRS